MKMVLNLTWRPGPVMSEYTRNVKCSDAAQKMSVSQTCRRAPRPRKDSRCPLVRAHAGGIAQWRPGTVENWPNGVVEDAAGSADPDLVRAACATCAFLRRRVPTAMCLLLGVRAPAQSEEPALAPLRAPGILKKPVLVPGACLSIADQSHRMVHGGFQGAIIHHAVVVDVPIVGRHERNADGPILQGAQDRFHLILRKLLPPLHAEIGRRLRRRNPHVHGFLGGL